MWWIVVGVVVVALVLLVSSLFALAGHVRPLRRALRRLRIRGEQAQRLQRRSDKLRTSLEGLQVKVEEAAARAERLRP
jgi:biopolymer transport protein ExbB/TolQ